MGDIVDLKEKYETMGGILLINNPYGYRVNVNHPSVQRLYWLYKERKKISRGTPLSDAERHEFEAVILQRLGKEPQHECDTGECQKIEPGQS